MAEHTIITEPIEYKKNVVVLPTAYLKDESSANLRMFLRKENSGTTFFIGNDPSNNALRLPYNVPCHNNNNNNITEDRINDINGGAPDNNPIKGPPNAFKADKNIGYDGFYNRAGPIGTSDCISWDDTMEAIKDAIKAIIAGSAAMHATANNGNIRGITYNELEAAIESYDKIIPGPNDATAGGVDFIANSLIDHKINGGGLGGLGGLADNHGVTGRNILAGEINNLFTDIKKGFNDLADAGGDDMNYNNFLVLPVTTTVLTAATADNEIKTLKRQLFHAKKRGYFSYAEIQRFGLVAITLAEIIESQIAGGTPPRGLGNIHNLLNNATPALKPRGAHTGGPDTMDNYMRVIQLRASQYASIRDFCPDLRCVARVGRHPIEHVNAKVTNSGDHTSNFRIYLPNYENNSELEGCYFEFIIVCNNSILEDDARVAGNNPAANLSQPVAPGDSNNPIDQGKLHHDRYGGIGSANIEIISHSYITQMYDKFTKEKEFNQAFPLPCKYTPYIDDPLTTKTYIRQLLKGDSDEANNYALPDEYGFSKGPIIAGGNLETYDDDFNYKENIKNIYGIHADFRPTHNQASTAAPPANNTNRTIEDRLYSQGKTIENNKEIAGVKFDGRDLTLSQFFNIYKNALNDNTEESPSLSSVNTYDTGEKNKTNKTVKKAFGFQKINITNNSLVRKEESPKTYANFINKNGAGRGVVDKRNIFADNVTTSYNPDEPCYGIDINPEEQYLAHRHANMVGTINCRGSKAYSANPSDVFAAPAAPPPNPGAIGGAMLGDIVGPVVKDGINDIIPVYNTLKHNDKGEEFQCGLGTPCDKPKPFHTIHINLNRLKYQYGNGGDPGGGPIDHTGGPNGGGAGVFTAQTNIQPIGGMNNTANHVGNNIDNGVAELLGENTAKTLKTVLNGITQGKVQAATNDNSERDNYNGVALINHTSEHSTKKKLRNAYPNKFNSFSESLTIGGNPNYLFGLHNNNSGVRVSDTTSLGGGNVDDDLLRNPAPPLHHPKMKPFGTAGGGAGSFTAYDDRVRTDQRIPKLITTNENSYADHRQSCVNKQIHIKCHYLDGMWRVEVITPNVHTLGGNQLLHQNPGFRDITFVRGRR